MKTYTDNYHLAPKVELRRHFVQKYHGARDCRCDECNYRRACGQTVLHDFPIRVLDCCQGDGVIWNAVRDQFKDRTFQYWGVDVKPKSGRLKVDSVRILAQPGWREDIVDVDTYGSPWKHWFAMLPNIHQSLTVFLTIGLITKNGSGSIGELALESLGIPKGMLFVGGPHHTRPSFSFALADISTDYCLARSQEYGLKITELVEAFPQHNARYMGLRIEPLK